MEVGAAFRRSGGDAKQVVFFLSGPMLRFRLITKIAKTSNKTT